MDAATITSSSFTLTPTGGSPVAATVSYSANVATLNPSAALANNTTYTAKLDTAIKAADGVALASAVTWSFTTVNAAPTVTAKTPADAATNVAVGSSATATFSRAMDATTITSSSFTLTPAGGSPVAATVSYSANVATLNPSAPLANNTTYTAKLDATIKAADGVALASAVTWSFTTANGAPTVTGKTPADGATGVATNIAPTATFSRAMNAATITSTSFTLTPSGGSPVAATVSCNSPCTTATLTPSGALANGTTYTAKVDTSATASDGVALASAVTWSFTTANGAPTVTAKTPADGATGVAVGVAPTATFSRAMEASTITTFSFTLTPAGGSPVAASVALTGNTATLTPSAPLATNTSYTAKLDTTVKAQDGVPLAAPVTWTFTTVNGAPTVTSTTPTAGAAGVATSTAPTATFSRAMDPSTITSSSFTLTPSGGTPVAATVALSGNTATLTPSAALASNTTYTAKLDTTVKAQDGAPLASPYTWTFTTATASNGPAVTSKSPADGATNVPTGYGSNVTKITATFDRTMDPASFTTATAVLKRPDGSQMPATPTCNSPCTTLTLTPTAVFDYAKTYSVTLTTGIKDAGGVPLGAPVTWSFTTTSTLIDPIRINAGATTPYTSPSTGFTWSADAYFKGGTTLSSPNTITGTTDPTLYKAQRVGNATSATWSYTISLPAGSYDVKLHFAEVQKTAAGQRVFNLDLFQTTGTDLASFDIYAQAGGANKALVKTFTGVVVNSGVSLRITTSVVTDFPAIAAIEVIPR
jgi:hypothetical protein